jgi:hypothetical protein
MPMMIVLIVYSLVAVWYETTAYPTWMTFLTVVLPSNHHTCSCRLPPQPDREADVTSCPKNVL